MNGTQKALAELSFTYLLSDMLEIDAETGRLTKATIEYLETTACESVRMRTAVSVGHLELAYEERWGRKASYAQRQAWITVEAAAICTIEAIDAEVEAIRDIIDWQ